MHCTNCRREIAESSNFCYFCGALQYAPAGPVSQRRLMRSSTDVKIAGVCAGFAEYFGIDSTVVRFVWVLLVLIPVPVVPAILGYVAAWIILPRAPLPMPASAPSPAVAAQSS